MLFTQQIWSDLLSESMTRSSPFPAGDIVVLHFLAGDEPIYLSSGQYNVKGCDESLLDLAPVIFLEILIGFLFLLTLCHMILPCHQSKGLSSIGMIPNSLAFILAPCLCPCSVPHLSSSHIDLPPQI